MWGRRAGWIVGTGLALSLLTGNAAWIGWALLLAAGMMVYGYYADTTPSGPDHGPPPHDVDPPNDHRTR